MNKDMFRENIKACLTLFNNGVIDTSEFIRLVEMRVVEVAETKEERKQRKTHRHLAVTLKEQLKKDFRDGKYKSQKELANAYNVSQGTVSKIMRS